MITRVAEALRHTWTLAAHDLGLWRRAPWAIAAALIPPVALGLLAYVLTLNLGHQPIALVQEGHGRYSNHIAGIFHAQAGDLYSLVSTDRATATRLLDSEQVAAVVVIPSNFDAAVARCPALKPDQIIRDYSYARSGCPAAQLQVTLNNVNHNYAAEIRRALSETVGFFDAPDVITPVAETQLDMSDLNPYRVNVMTALTRASTVDYIHYAVIPCLVLLILSVGVMGTALLCARDIERGTARHLALAPVSPVVLVAGRLLGGVLLSLIVIVPTLAIAAWTGAIAPPAGHWPALGLVFLATAACAAGLGAALGAILRGVRAVSMAAAVICTYLFFLGGGFTTVQFLPTWLHRLTEFVPTSYAIDGLRQSLFYPGLYGFGADMRVLLGTALLAVAVGGVVVRRAWSR
ncbi:MAG: ABC transporter permease [Actinobacteria bacterium]|nr:ABC transporter permease [Actinomycetota bacterium]